MLTFNNPEKEAFQNIEGKGENAGNHPRKNFCFKLHLILWSANALNLDQSKNLSFGKKLNSLCFNYPCVDIIKNIVGKGQ